MWFFLLLLRCFSLSSLSAEISDQLSAQHFFFVEIVFRPFFANRPWFANNKITSLPQKEDECGSCSSFGLLILLLRAVHTVHYFSQYFRGNYISKELSRNFYPWGERKGNYPALTLNLLLLLLVQTHEILFCLRNGHFFPWEFFVK